MSAALKNVTSICLRFSRAARIKTPAVLPRCAFLHSTRQLASVNITRQLISPNIFNVLSDSRPTSDGLVNIAPSDIISLKKLLGEGDLSAACKFLINIKTTSPPPEELSTEAATSLGKYIPDTALQPVISQLFETLIAEGGNTPDLPKPLELLEEMKGIGVARASHYTTLLIEVMRGFTSEKDILPVFDASISFNSENLRELMHMTSELYSLKIDTATPHFLALLILQSLSATSEPLTSLQNAIGISPCPTLQHIRHFLDHHNFPSDKARYILSLLESYFSATLHTNPFTIFQEISRATTPEELTKLYTLVRTPATPATTATTATPANPATPATTTLAPSVYTRFATSFLELGRQTEAISCWNDMISSGISPTVVQWNELMKAFSKDKNLTPLHQVWQRMLQSGCVPDHHCWTTRIHALLSNNYTDAGLKYLREMQTSSTPPTTATINAVLDGLLKNGHITEAEAVLSTAQKLGIKKDIATYNTLFQSLIKQQKTNNSKFSSLITLTREMQADNVVPDIRTVTLILDGMYKYAPQRPSLESVIGLLTYIESVGININTITYTSILHALLDEGNEPAAMGILEIMADRGVIVNNTTYTVLLRHYFTHSDLVSAERVLAEMEGKRIKSDFQTYKEVLCGFAACGNVKRMNDYLKLMKERNIALSPLAYISVINALVKRELWFDARGLIVELVSREIVGSARDARHKTTEHAFWQRVAALKNGAIMMSLQKEGVVEED